MNYRSAVSDRTDAVSAVIGVILMVAITVILAAIIASMTLGMTKQIPYTKVVTVTTSQPDADTIVITYQGGQDAGSVIGACVTVDEVNKFMMGHTQGSAILPIGCSTTIKSTTTGQFKGKNHVLTTAFFSDGTQQVVLDAFI
jgi:hypothetical protein